MTTGIISSLDRSLQIHGNRTIRQIIQVDAAINPGSSGGPLLDSHSRLIGINTAIASKTGQSAGVGFAIPVNLVSRIVPQLIAHGQVVRPEIGISRVFQTEQGLLVAKLQAGGPARRPACVVRKSWSAAGPVQCRIGRPQRRRPDHRHRRPQGLSPPTTC